jgi:hypothetical protein
MSQISTGVISKEAWAARCKELGIENIPLVLMAQSGETTTQQPSTQA